MRAHLPVLLVALGVLAAGCLSAAPEAAPVAPAGDAPAPRDPSPSGTPQPAPRAAPANDSGGAGASEGWPALADATIRPGVQVIADGAQCTSNFVFASADNATLYLGLAAHCVDHLELGDPLDIANGEATGTLAYSSWLTMKEVDEEDEDALKHHDFALVEIPDDARHLVHPAMRHFGGPTALADAAGIAAGDKILTYGNSGLRGQIDQTNRHEGVVLERESAWRTQVYTVAPGVPGDSGSGVLTGDGRALGVLVTLTIAPTAGSNGVTHLDAALAYAHEHAGLDVRLATWKMLAPTLAPSA